MTEKAPDFTASTDVDSPARRTLDVSGMAWVFFLIAVIAPALTVDSIPFAGPSGVFAAGGSIALRIGLLGLPLVISFALWAVDVFKRPRLRYTPWLWWLAGLAGWAGIATATAIDRRIAFWGYWTDEQGLIVWLMYALIAFLGSQLVTSRRRLTTLASCVVGTAAVVAFIAVLEVAGFRIFGIPAEEWAYSRGVSTMMNPDFLGTFLVLPALLGVALAGALDGWRRWAAVLASSVITLSLLYSLTRGAWIGFVAGLLVLGVLWLLMRRVARSESGESASAQDVVTASPRLKAPLAWGAAAAVLVAGAVVLGLGGIGQRIAETFGGKTLDQVLSGRPGIWREIVDTIVSRPLFGVGPGNTIHGWQRFASERTLSTVGSSAIVDSAHNVALDLAVQFGVPFLVAALVGVVWLSVRTVRAAVVADSPLKAQIVPVGWVAAGAGMGVAYLTGVTTMPMMTITASFIGVLLAIDVRRTLAPSRAARMAIVVVAMAASLALGAFSAASASSAVAGNQAAASTVERAQNDLAALRRAPWRILPARDLVTVTQAMGEAEEAVVGVDDKRALDMLLARDPYSALAQYAAGDYYLMQERKPDEALKYAERALRLRPLFVGGLMLKGDSLVALGRTEEGLRFQQRAVDLEETAPVLHAFEAPWTSYMSTLIAQIETDPSAARTASDVLARYRERFPQSPDASAFAEALAASQAQ